MEITYLVGNGFDMMYGLKTSYNQFYEYMLREFSKNKIKNNFFYNQIKEDVVKWSDFEWMIGLSTKSEREVNDFLAKNEQFTETDLGKELFDKKHFLDSLEEFHEDFENYLKMEEEKAYIPNLEDALISFLKELDDVFFTQIAEVLHPKMSPCEIKINFLQFNYTNILDRAILKIDWEVVEKSLYELLKIDETYKVTVVLGENIHVHESLGKGSFLGVNDRSQLNMSLFSTAELNYLIKPETIDEYDYLKLGQLYSIINRTGLFVIFGMSLGATDLLWWQELIKKVINENVLIVLHRFNKKLTFNKSNSRKYLEIAYSTRRLLFRYKTSAISIAVERKVIPLVNSENLFVDQNYIRSLNLKSKNLKSKNEYMLNH
ncbi:hypothetical protein JSZ40_002826 [Listeria monocytogenes]|nr:hypothetical protein [Listeria monocytogenes]EAW7188404.1 hypothetical protein [Listeria monocytogenes]EHC6476745.1 hypothetical protein [Listeria monocytogenes]